MKKQLQKKTKIPEFPVAILKRLQERTGGKVEEKRILKLDRYDYKILINALNEFRTKLINENVECGIVDDLLIKVIDAPVEKRKLSLGRTKGSFTHESR